MGRAAYGDDRQSAAAGGIATVAILGSFGPAGITAARSFRAQGMEVVYLEVGGRGTSPRSSAVSRVIPIQQGTIGTEEGFASIADAIERTGSQALLPLWDTEMMWLARRRDSLPAGCKLLAPGVETLERAQSKHKQIEIARECGFRVLPTWALVEPAQAREIDRAAYPICLRPAIPEHVSPTFKVRLFASPEEMTAFLNGLTWGPEPLLAQPFRAQPSLVVHGARSESGRVLALEGFLASVKFQGVALELRPWRCSAQLLACCERFVRELRIDGPFHFDLLYSAEEDTAHYLEINTRLGGTTDKVCALGFDEPMLALAAYGVAAPASEFRTLSGRVAVDRRFLLKQMVWALRGRLTPLDYPDVTRSRRLLHSLRSLLWAKESMATLQDIRGSLAYYGALRALLRHAFPGGRRP